MSTANGTGLRPDKESNAETVLYEIDLLRFARNRWRASKTKGDGWVYLEDFLLHYRNLIEFFGKPKVHLRPGDLSIHRPESIWNAKMPEKEIVDSMARLDLWEKYDSSDNHESISKYLHHCTEQRTEQKSWPVETMYEELRSTIEKCESLLPKYRPTEELESSLHPESSMFSNSTASTRILHTGLFPEK